MTDVRLPQHGRDHRPGGSDPIPSVTGFRIVHGRIYDDGSTLWEGSGDWSATFTLDGIEVVIDPPFEDGYDITITPNDNTDSIPSPPQLVLLSGLSMSGFVMGQQIDLETFRVVFWDLDGNAMQNRCGFDFQAVGT